MLRLTLFQEGGGGDGISGIIVPNFPRKCQIFKDLSVWRESSPLKMSWAGWGGVLTLELSQYMLFTFASNQSIHARHGDPHPCWKEASEWLLWEVPFWSLRGFLKSRVSLVSLVSVIKLWLGDWLTGWWGWLMPTMYMPLVLVGVTRGQCL